jgi:hypothetical protein
LLKFSCPSKLGTNSWIKATETTWKAGRVCSTTITEMALIHPLRTRVDAGAATPRRLFTVSELSISKSELLKTKLDSVSTT